MWLIHARIQYGKKGHHRACAGAGEMGKVTPPVIIVDKIPIPEAALIPRASSSMKKTYAGTWSGGDHRG